MLVQSHFDFQSSIRVFQEQKCPIMQQHHNLSLIKPCDQIADQHSILTPVYAPPPASLSSGMRLYGGPHPNTGAKSQVAVLGDRLFEVQRTRKEAPGSSWIIGNSLEPGGGGGGGEGGGRLCRTVRVPSNTGRSAQQHK